MSLALFDAVKQGDVFQNPGGGTSIVKKVTDKMISYVRGHSTIYLPVNIFNDVCRDFKGKSCSSNNLKNYLPSIFCSKHGGHSCNCTFLFSLAVKMGLTNDGISGKGVVGSPFYIDFN